MCEKKMRITAHQSQRATRLKQILEWLGSDFDGVVAFDESHKAKNLVPRKSEPTKVGKAVEELQKKLLEARFLYCSATGMQNLGIKVGCPVLLDTQPLYQRFFVVFFVVQRHATLHWLVVSITAHHSQASLSCATLPT